jgi:hypothetical protein
MVDQPSIDVRQTAGAVVGNRTLANPNKRSFSWVQTGDRQHETKLVGRAGGDTTNREAPRLIATPAVYPGYRRQMRVRSASE